MPAVGRPLAAAIAAALLCGVAQCTILIKKDLQDLAREAEAVVLARAVSSQAVWDAANRLIWTETALDIEETWAGDVKGPVALRELGGEVGQLGMRVNGAPQYRVGEDYVVFLHRDALGQWRTLGWTQGQFRVTADPARPRGALAHPSHAHVIDGYIARSAGTPVGPVELQTLKARTQQLVAAAKAEKK
jgi:hypothetical protein